MKQGCCFICKIVGLLVIIGAINWGLVGILQINLVEKLLGDMTVGARVVYGLVGVAGLMKLAMCFKACPCSGDSSCKKS